MENDQTAINLIFEANNIDKEKTTNLVTEALQTMDDGEAFFEYRATEVLALDDGRLKNSSFNINSGFGLRGIINDSFAYSHSTIIDYNELEQASKVVKSIADYKQNYSHNLSEGQIVKDNNRSSLYIANNPINELDFTSKINILNDIDKYLRDKNPYVKQVSASMVADWQVVAIINREGKFSYDVRPLVRLTISIIAEKDGRMEVGSYSSGGRESYMKHLCKENWQNCADEALKIALINLESIPAPAGEMQVILGPGWPGILLHEAIGHGLEGDFNRKKTSAFSNLIGKRVASPGVTIVDDGTIANRRGSLNIDDEGNKTNNTTLIEDGILVGYIQDKMNARLMNDKLTGNGRRENFASAPMPRMTNTYMLNGEHHPDEIFKSVKNGLYAVNFGGGQVDITSGKFVFSTSLAYLIEDGKITVPVKGATLIGNGPDILTKVSMVANDMALDPGVGTCGKAGQSVPVGVGQPTILVDSITVGGTG